MLAYLSLGMYGVPYTPQEIQLPSEISSETEEYVLCLPRYSKIPKLQHVSWFAKLLYEDGIYMDINLKFGF